MLEIAEYIERGGVIVTLLIGLNIFGFTLMLWKFLLLTLIRWRELDMVERVLVFVKRHNEAFDKELLDNALRMEIQKLEFGLSSIKIIALIAPLLGLLGTVLGVLSAFDAIAKQGLGDPAVFSSGISVALITTVAGLIVAIPHYIGYNYLIARLDVIELHLEQEVLAQL